MPTREDFISIIRRYQAGTATPEEIRLVEQYYDWYDSEEGISASLTESEKTELKAKMLANIHGQRNNETGVTPVHRVHFIRRFRWVAAAIFLFAIAGTWALLQNKPVQLSQAARLQNHIRPGITGSTLTLSDGRTIVLDTAGNGVVIAGFTKGTDGLTVSETNIDYATVSTPKGHIEKVVLNDGTIAWLNAGSSLRFPTSFNGNTREVSMTGEVYFEVAKDASKHFFVKTINDLIEVKGTHFNVNAYGNTVRTTLLEGAVAIGKSVLTPGNQYESGKISEADTEEAMAWKNGMFRFNGANIREIMNEVSRWYNVEITYDGDVSQLDFNAAIPRSTNVAELLKILELTRSVEFRIEGDKIIVKQL